MILCPLLARAEIIHRMTDVQLLEKHREGCQTAFAELVRRHLGWICSVARRRIHDVHLAEDVAQAVFIVLHRKAPRFGEDRAMMGWLHRTACYATAAAIKSRYRQRLHERQAALLAPPTTPAQSEPQWEQLAPMLDELVGQLPRPDRDAILLRFYRELTFPQIGAQTGVSEEAARKRVNRALEKLRHLAGRRGMSWSAASLGPILTAKVICPVSQESMASITTGAGAVSASCAPIVKGVTLMMAYSHAKIAAIAAAVLLIVLSGTLLISRDWNVSAAQRDEQGSAASDAPARHGYALLSPFTGARWNGTNYQVLYNGTWYDLLAINKQPLATIVDFAQGQYREKWQKRIDEDLVEVLDAIGAPAKVADNDKSGSVSLVLRTLDTK
jgi:RNA polymerase sigma factor (sigma-70 family)